MPLKRTTIKEIMNMLLDIVNYYRPNLHKTKSNQNQIKPKTVDQIKIIDQISKELLSQEEQNGFCVYSEKLESCSSSFVVIDQWSSRLLYHI